MTQVPSTNPITLAVALAVVALAGAACGSAPSKSQRFQEATKTAERPVAMKGESSFFDGEISATVTVSRGFGRNYDERGGRHGPYGEAPSVTQVFINELNDPDITDYEATYQKMRALQLRGSPLPPVLLKLHLSNTTKEPVEVDILELNSDLGNFAVKPNKLTIPAEQVGTPEAMTSQLGVTSDEIPVKVRLRRAGKIETQTILVKSLFTSEGKKVDAEKK